MKPVTQPQTATAKEIPEDPVPDLRLEAPAFPLRLVTMRGAPGRPHVNAPSSGDTETDAERPDAPMIAPQLSPQETAVAQQQTSESLRIADKNLASTRGKRMNATQSDLVSKIRGFLKDAREAAQIADWSRARSLAKKAQVLSEELAGSL